MLPKSKRLNLKRDFKWVAAGQNLDTKYAKLFLRMGSNTTAKIGVAISSDFKKATQRNRAKRVTFTAFKSLYSHLPPKINIVVLPKQSVLGVKSGDVLADLEKKLKDEKIIS